MYPSIHNASLQAAQKKETNEAFKSADNLKLLWRGFYLSIVVGILSQWLRIVPPETLKNDSLIDKVVRDDASYLAPVIFLVSASRLIDFFCYT
jgi:hypothetical protein